MSLNADGRPKRDLIRDQNDAFRTSFAGGKVLMTQGVSSLDESNLAVLIGLIRTFTAFDADNDSSWRTRLRFG